MSRASRRTSSTLNLFLTINLPDKHICLEGEKLTLASGNTTHVPQIKKEKDKIN